jgi:hypothetical protein
LCISFFPEKRYSMRMTTSVDRGKCFRRYEYSSIHVYIKKYTRKEPEALGAKWNAKLAPTCWSTVYYSRACLVLFPTRSMWSKISRNWYFIYIRLI